MSDLATALPGLLLPLAIIAVVGVITFAYRQPPGGKHR